MQKYNLSDFMGRFTEVEKVPALKLFEELPEATEQGPWIAGGVLRRTLIGDEIDSDIDYFFANEKQRDEFVEELKEMKFSEVSKNEHQTTLLGTVDSNDVTVQAVHIRYYTNIEEVLDSFDFTITQFGYDGLNLYCGDYALWDLARRKLALHKLTYGVATLRRIIKYSRQGFTACGGVLADILEKTIANPETINGEVKYID